ncbi:MAG TPA: energy transducer TonB [Gemmatimonadaceae bacterium]|nr:energy transducer TonB [Gemmatimonadaceae bacterium]
MRLIRLSGDSASEYQFAASNGAWEYADRISPDQVAALLTALRGEAGHGVAWRTDPPPHSQYPPGHQPPSMAAGNPRPEYPPRALLNLAAGEVVAQFAVGIDGKAKMESLLIVRSTHPLFSLAVRKVLPSMRFIPATVDGKRVEEVVVQEFDFKFR